MLIPFVVYYPFIYVYAIANNSVRRKDRRRMAANLLPHTESQHQRQRQVLPLTHPNG